MFNHSFRTRHLRKAEAAQLKKEALQTATKKKEEPVSSKAEAVAKEESSSEDSSGNVTSTESKADVSTVVKKKQYTLNILSEVDTNVEQNPSNVVPVNPQEFAKQERLRKQREKQAKFQQEFEKKKLTETTQSAAFKENNLLVEDGPDMWEALSQIPEMGRLNV